MAQGGMRKRLSQGQGMQACRGRKHSDVARNKGRLGSVDYLCPCSVSQVMK